VTKLIGGLAFATVKANYYKRGLLQVFQPSPRFRWVATAPGCSATGATADGALARLRARVIVASKELGK
jgi:hypothetical protein